MCIYVVFRMPLRLQNRTCQKLFSLKHFVARLKFIRDILTDLSSLQTMMNKTLVKINVKRYLKLYLCVINNKCITNNNI